jgi:DNA-binding beta-propeller fold protein YncE
MEVLATLPFSMDNLAVDSRNQVYVSSDADGYIAKILPKGNYILLNPGGMIFPSGVAVQQRPDGGESVYVGDMWSLREFDGRTGKSRGVASGGIISAGLTSFPLSVSPDGNNLIVAAPFNYKVQIYDPVNHQVLEDYSNPIYPSVPFLPVNAIRFQGDIWATDAATGLVVRRISGIWTPIFPATAPVGLATNGNNLWVADYALGMVFRIGSAAPVASGLNGPEGLAYYPPDGSLLVIESGAGRLSKINPTTGAKTILAEGLELGIHWLPPGLVAASDAMIDGVAVGPSGAIYVTGNKANVLYRIEIHP